MYALFIGQLKKSSDKLEVCLWEQCQDAQNTSLYTCNPYKHLDHHELIKGIHVLETDAADAVATMMCGWYLPRGLHSLPLHM